MAPNASLHLLKMFYPGGCDSFLSTRRGLNTKKQCILIPVDDSLVVATSIAQLLSMARLILILSS